jgi:hypothetical protein
MQAPRAVRCSRAGTQPEQGPHSLGQVHIYEHSLYEKMPAEAGFPCACLGCAKNKAPLPSSRLTVMRLPPLRRAAFATASPFADADFGVEARTPPPIPPDIPRPIPTKSWFAFSSTSLPSWVSATCAGQLGLDLLKSTPTDALLPAVNQLWA